MSCTELCVVLDLLERSFSDEYSITATVLLTTYNITPMVEKTLTALKQQTYPAHLLEVIVADDGSSDGIEQLLSRSEFPWNVRIVQQEDNGFRLASVRNRGILNARNDVIINLDGDMLPMRSFVESHMRWFHIGQFFATIGYRRFVDSSNVSVDHIAKDVDSLLALPHVASVSNWHRPDDRRLAELSRFDRHPAPYNVFHGCNVAYLRAHALDVGLYDVDFDGHWGYEDTEFAYRLWRQGLTFVTVPSALALHQENEVVSFEARVAGDEHNFRLACSKIPGFHEFKSKLRMAERRPWW